MTHSAVTIRITPESAPSTPSWMGEVAAFAQVLEYVGILKAIQEQVRWLCCKNYEEKKWSVSGHLNLF
jgi:hypothetical protein